MFLTYFSITFLYEAAEMSQCFSMHRLSKHYLGKFGSSVTLVVITIGNWSVLVNIFQIFADFIPAFVRDWTEIDDVHFLSSRLFAVIVGTLLTLPWIAVRNISALTPLSALSMSLGVTVILVMVSNAVKCAAEDGLSDSLVYVETDPLSIFRGLSAMAWCWAIHFNVLPIYNSIDADAADDLSDRRTEMRIVTLGTVITTMVLFAIEGLSVYLVWGSDVDFDFLLNLSHSDPNYIFFFSRWLSTLMQFVICGACLGSIPLLTFAARENLHSMIGAVHKRVCNGHGGAVADENDEEQYMLIGSSDVEVDVAEHDSAVEVGAGKGQSAVSRLVEGSVLVLSAAVVALYFTKLSDAIALSGSTYCCYMCFTLPSMLYLKATSSVAPEPAAIESEHSADVRRKRMIARFEIAFAVVIGVGGITTVFVGGVGG